MATKPKKIWDNYKELAEIKKSDRIKFVISGAARDGIKYVNIREFYMRQRDQQWMPGRDGITIPLVYPAEHGTKMLYTLKDLIAALPDIMTSIEEMPISGTEVWYTPKEGK